MPRMLWLSLVVIGLDRLSKLLALHFLTLYEPVPVLPFMNITLAHNTGAAFSLLANMNGWQNILFAVLAVLIATAITVWIWRLPRRSYWLATALSLILGGALGNLWDRVQYGYVVDYLDFYIHSWHWPVFNIADSAICIGAAMLLFSLLRHE